MSFLSKFFDTRISKLEEKNLALQEKLLDYQDAVVERDHTIARLNAEIRRLQTLNQNHSTNYQQLVNKLESLEYRYLQILNQAMSLASLHEDAILRIRARELKEAEEKE